MLNKTDQLLQIIKKAEQNGFNFHCWQLENTNIPLFGLVRGNIEQLLQTNYYKLMLLDKEFVQTFFGEQNLIGNCEYHLQQLVLEDDLISYYIKYLGE